MEPVSLEMGEESEDELEGLAGLAPRGGGGGSGSPVPGAPDELRAQRFLLLRDLWATTAP